MTEPTRPCGTCGMPCTPGEYHPYAACLMFKACHNSETVRANLEAVRGTPPAVAPWRSAVLDLIDECPGLTMEQDQWLSRRVKELDFASAPQPTQAQAGAVPLTDEQIDAVAESMPGGLDGFLKGWGWRQFAREILTLRRMPDWEPQFDCMTPKQEELAVQFCQEIAGPRGNRGSPPDPVRLLEMAEALYKAERDAAHGIKGGQHDD